ncbi:hypothetical protein ACSLBF_10440 [Pseudoalteromonas sp. T1lg65]|uniref:hypothetical protein n=1 Tax=Pseudoalteromonas sp. T1lg65 TaxID=2077101 RepID=UPI003F7A45DC
MTDEQVLLIAEIMIWVGVVFSTPFLYAVSYQFIRFLRLTYKTHHQISLIDEKGNELVLTMKKGKKKQSIVKILKESLNDAKQSSL